MVRLDVAKMSVTFRKLLRRYFDESLQHFIKGKLKGHCHAIWQLYKRLEGVFSSIKFQN